MMRPHASKLDGRMGSQMILPDELSSCVWTICTSSMTRSNHWMPASGISTESLIALGGLSYHSPASRRLESAASPAKGADRPIGTGLRADGTIRLMQFGAL